MNAKHNLRLWHAVCVTDPQVTKKVKLPGGFTATAVDANWLLEKATGIFGPVGMGHGWTIKGFALTGEIATVHIGYWYMLDGIKCEFDAIASNVVERQFKEGPGKPDDDAFKKALTDAVKSALTKLGFMSDIHQGYHDDPRYVAQVNDDLAAKEEAARNAAKKAPAAAEAKQEAPKQEAPKQEEPAKEQQPAAQELTREQRCNALYIRLKRADPELAASMSAHKGKPDELEELARALGRVVYKELAKIDANTALAIISSATKGADGKMTDPVGVLDKLTAALKAVK